MINWKYIKGLWGNDATSLYTFLEFKNSTGLTDFAKTPVIKINNTNTLPADDATGDFGHIITQKATGQSIDTEFAFNADIMLRAGCKIYTVSGKHLIQSDSNNTVVDIGHGYSRVDIDTSLKAYGSIIATGSAQITGDITSSGKCEAQYFNATSDRRAKTNIKSLDFNALDLIKKVQLYSFTYKDTDTKSIGIIAQDVQSVSLDGFKLVDHEDASGKDMDYMTVHESKLVYILWKAIQEQQKEIEDLKQELKKRG